MNRKIKILNSLLVKPAGPDCNLDCTYCFYHKHGLFPDTQNHRMTEEIQEEMIRQAMGQSAGKISFAWQGGEPTLTGLPFFQRSVELQQRYGQGGQCANGLQTNGVLIDDKWSRFLRQYNFLVGLSLDGPEHVHDRYRRTKSGNGTWSKIADNAKRMLDQGVAVNAVTVVNDYSAEYPEEIYAFHKSLGLNYMQFIPCLEADADHPGKAAPFSVSAEQYGRFLCRMFDFWMADFRDGLPTTFIRFFDAVFYRYAGMSPPDCTLLEECGDYVVVEHNGDVYACDFFVEPRWRLGNMMRSSLTDMLNSPRQREFGKRKTILPDLCKSCRWTALCRGGCMKDRMRIPTDQHVNAFCGAFKMFFEHADERFRKLAEDWKINNTRPDIKF
ncbi:MAG: anaerobic sulfatase maturase [Deltaproteobacteria bacterium]|nr:anaerobic sulfatase maturase [Deltaproteobacteria bacterium]